MWIFLFIASAYGVWLEKLRCKMHLPTKVEVSAEDRARLANEVYACINVGDEDRFGVKAAAEVANPPGGTLVGPASYAGFTRDGNELCESCKLQCAPARPSTEEVENFLDTAKVVPPSSAMAVALQLNELDLWAHSEALIGEYVFDETSTILGRNPKRALEGFQGLLSVNDFFEAEHKTRPFEVRQFAGSTPQMDRLFCALLLDRRLQAAVILGELKEDELGDRRSVMNLLAGVSEGVKALRDFLHPISPVASVADAL